MRLLYESGKLWIVWNEFALRLDFMVGPWLPRPKMSFNGIVLVIGQIVMPKIAIRQPFDLHSEAVDGVKSR